MFYCPARCSTREMPCRTTKLLFEVFQRGFDAILEANGGQPAQETLGLATVEIGQVDIAGTPGGARNLWSVAGQLCQFFVDLVDGDGTARADAEDIVVAAFKRQQVCSCYILDKHVILALLAIPVDAYPLMVEETFGKDRYDARLAIGVLTRPVDVAIAQCGISQAVGLLPVAQVVFPDHLGNAVRRLRMLHHLFVNRQMGRGTIGGTGRGKNNLTGANARAVAQHVEQTKHIDTRIEHRIFRGDGDAVLSCLVADDLWLYLIENACQPGLVGNIRAIELCLWIQICEFAAALTP